MALTKKQLLEWLADKSDDAEIRLGDPAASMAVVGLIYEWDDDGTMARVYVKGVV